MTKDGPALANDEDEEKGSGAQQFSNLQKLRIGLSSQTRKIET